MLRLLFVSKNFSMRHDPSYRYAQPVPLFAPGYWLLRCVALALDSPMQFLFLFFKFLFLPVLAALMVVRKNLKTNEHQLIVWFPMGVSTHDAC